jgi:hypothetical protein
LSVVPISVRPSHGSAKIERPDPAGTIAPAPIGTRSVDSVMWVPRLGRMRGISSSAYSSSPLIRSAHTPVAFTMLSARISTLRPPSRSSQTTPHARPSSSSSDTTSQRFAITAPKRSASPSTVSTSRASSVWQS